MEIQRQRIVVIDDNENDLQVIKRLLDRRNYDAIPATSGEEGLRIAQQIVPDAIVVDYRMPGMDGFEVTRRIKSDPALMTIPVLMLTGSDAAEVVVQGLGVGADDFVTKGSDIEIVVARLRALLRMKAYQDQLRRMNQQMTRDLQIARRVQEALVPERTFRSQSIEIRSAYIPSEVLSGDFYDYFLVEDSMYLFVADVSGHGLPAAILTSLLKSYIHTEATNDRSLSDFMARLNDFLFSASLPTQFATAALFRVDGGRELVYSNAAHPPFLLHQRETGRTIVLEQPSNLLGAMPKMTFEEHSINVAPGDTLFVYTDGLTDRVNRDREFYSIDRVAALLDNAGDADLDAVYDSIYADVSNFAATEEFKDDIAFVVTRFH
ncbi:MAG TPA: fused response regulator/phosphatase [Thermoanaerobaculia bacterium]|jgi:serine phosphatase RsbU (regulator of sigma subunit)|nr:fused response regulator/phosphatase [Thermoanaerobaculia bacterium]